MPLNELWHGGRKLSKSNYENVHLVPSEMINNKGEILSNSQRRIFVKGVLFASYNNPKI